MIWDPFLDALIDVMGRFLALIVGLDFWDYLADHMFMLGIVQAFSWVMDFTSWTGTWVNWPLALYLAGGFIAVWVVVIGFRFVLWVVSALLPTMDLKPN